jgi:UDP:flavonoid glycosyltransferase YjiC (YdhE family)
MASMRVLFSTTAGAGHFGPMIPVAHACQAAGHSVAVAAPSSFADSVADAGLAHLPFPDVPTDQMGAVFGRLPSLPREEANRMVVGEIFGRLDAQAALPDAARSSSGTGRPTSSSAIRPSSARWSRPTRVGLPQVQVAIDMGGFIPAMADTLDEPIRELEQLAGHRRRRGAQRVLATSTFSSVPAVLDHPASGPVWRYRIDTSGSGPSLPAEWGDADAPLVYVSFGSVAGSMGRFDALYPAILEVLADLPVRVLMTTGKGYDPTRLDPRPANTWATSWWPQAAAMRAAALVVGHGGFGTTMTALAAGVPQLVLPLFSPDQFLNAERVEAVGVGVRLLGGLEALSGVPAAVRELLDQPGYAGAAHRVAADMAALPDVTTHGGRARGARLLADHEPG